METQTPPRKKLGPHARRKAREAAAGAAPLQDQPSTRANRPPRVKPYVERTSSEELTVPLSPDDWTQKTRVLLGVSREKTQLEADYEAAKADHKKRIKDKVAEYTELEAQLQSGTEKRIVPLLVRFYLKERRKVILNAATKKKVRDEPMTPAEVREVSASQPELLPGGHGTAPAQPAALVPAALSEPAATTPTPAPEGFADSPTIFGAPREGEQQTELPAGGGEDDDENED